MCGIYGNIAAKYSSDPAELLAHRGPDGHGARQFRASPLGPTVTLGHRRLAILDLSAAATQPMANEDETLWVTFNGEIYNFQELRYKLQQAGHEFRSQSDTEVLLHGYEEWGEALLNRLDGMFAFALWDSGRSRLWLARDRLGKKPLFYYLDNRHLVFGSEIKAVLAASVVPRDPDPEGLDHFLTYFYFPHPRTAFRDIHKLPPGSSLRITIAPDGTLTQQSNRYWDPIESACRQPRLDTAEASSQTRALLCEAIQKRLVSDVPLGAFLSGGLDSSSIVALAATDIHRPLSAFSISFPGNSHYDETTLASTVAQQHAQNHTLLPVMFSAAEWLPKVVRHFDEPFGNPTAVLQYHLTRAVRPHVTVALSGDGGDEAFLGYYRYQGAQWAERYRRLPGMLTSTLRFASTLMPEAANGWHTPRRAREFLEFGGLPEVDTYLRWIGYFGAEQKSKLYTPAWRSSLNGCDPSQFLRHLYSQAAPLDGVNRLSYVDLLSFLCCNVLEYSDRMSMANSVEVRCPFTDPALVEMALGLPVAAKLHSGRGKWPLRQAVTNCLPAAILNHRKQGFSPPLERWMSTELRPLLDKWLGPKAIERRGMFQPNAIASLRRAHESGRRDNSVHLWGLLALEAWFRIYFDGVSEAELRSEIRSVITVA
ncbi:MAG TPA: asparagine synthase (glutamine-hydrolyzing) [Terriglobales bacterium]|nr:asparagine synthase (glutamine-hydrolyzing) [Terriglobales bacterium]